jgi:uncharacterized protein (DUF779 family)
VSANYGTNALFTISANPGYHIADVRVDGVSVGAVPGYLFPNVAGNHTISASFGVDIAPAFTSIAPPQNAFINTTTVGYTLNKDVVSGTVVFADLSSSFTHTFTGLELKAGSHSVDTGLLLVNGAVYSVTFTADDGLTTGTASVNNVTYDITAALPTIVVPQSNTSINTSSVSYSLTEAISSGGITITRTGGASDAGSPHTYALGTADRSAGAHSVNTGAVLADGGVYTITIDSVTDLAGNTTSPVSSVNITFDTQSVSITNITPARKSIITNATAGYRLSKMARSGKVTFSRTGGTADPGSPQVYTLTGAELNAGSHTVNTGFALVDEAFYTVSFEAMDLAGNPAATVSNALVFYDNGYGKRPAGKVVDDGTTTVNDNDVKKMDSVMGGRPGDPNWNPACDLDHNNVIDQKDRMILMQHYGK